MNDTRPLMNENCPIVMNEVHPEASVWAYPIRVAGITFRVKDMSEIQSDNLWCEREPNNQHDPMAVAVHVLQDGTRKHIGYVPREMAATISDSQLPCGGKIIWKGEGSHIGIRIVI